MSSPSDVYRHLRRLGRPLISSRSRTGRSSSDGATDFVFASPSLVGSCSCEKVGFEGKGTSCVNFYSHSSATREASEDKDPYFVTAAFNPDQVEWKGNPINSSLPEYTDLYMPKGSNNPHYYCTCERKEYLGVDAVRWLGMICLNLKRVKGFPHNVPDIYRPNHHIFYDDNRVVDVADGLPKWKTILEGELVPEMSHPSENRPIHKFGSAHKEDADDVNGKTNSNVKRTPEWCPSLGRVRKDVLPLSPTRLPEPQIYHFTENDPPVNFETKISPESLQRRVERKYLPSPGVYIAPAKDRRDVIVVGGGHNGLVSAAYLSKAGMDTLVLERRNIIGGAAVTEEIIPGFKFSRASYLAGLMRPQIITELQLEKYGFKYLPRNPSSFTPTLLNSSHRGKYLMLGDDEKANHNSIAQFSLKDADAFSEYERFLGQSRELLQPLLDAPLPNPMSGNIRDRLRSIGTMRDLISVGYRNREILVPFYELLTGTADHILNRWFESEILKTTLATDAVIGALVSPKQNGSAYVLLHHCMGEAAGKKGVWSYMEGGMGTISSSIAASAQAHGSEIVTNATVRGILTRGDRVTGVLMSDGSEIYADTVLSGCSPYHTFMELIPGLVEDSGFDNDHGGYRSPSWKQFIRHMRFTDFSCGAFKINCAVDSLPNFTCYPSPKDGSAGPMHRGTIHFESQMEEIEHAYREASMGIPATRPVIEMTIPSSVDNTIAPEGKHVVQLFVQFAPYDINPKIGNWADPSFKEAFADRVFRIVDEFCPGFSNSVIGRDVMSPLDLEKIFGFHKGNIFHGSLSLHQLGYARPMSGYADHRTPIKGLYTCSSGNHPGGGVMGAAGKNCATIVLGDMSSTFIG